MCCRSCFISCTHIMRSLFTSSLDPSIPALNLWFLCKFNWKDPPLALVNHITQSSSAHHNTFDLKDIFFKFVYKFFLLFHTLPLIVSSIFSQIFSHWVYLTRKFDFAIFYVRTVTSTVTENFTAPIQRYLYDIVHSCASSVTTFK